MLIRCPGKDCLFTSKILILDSSRIYFKYFMCIKREMLCITRFSFKNLPFPLLFLKIACLACSYAAKNNDRTSGFAKKICFWLKCWRWVLSSWKCDWQVFFHSTWGLSDQVYQSRSFAVQNGACRRKFMHSGVNLLPLKILLLVPCI